MTDYEIKAEIEEKLNDLYRIADHYVPLSQQGRFGEYDNAKEAMIEMVNDYLYLGEEHETVKTQYEELQKKYDKLQEELRDVVNDLETIVELDTDEENDGMTTLSNDVINSVNSDITSITKRIEELSYEDWDPYKKTGKKRK